jgi:hypothetical protein
MVSGPDEVLARACPQRDLCRNLAGAPGGLAPERVTNTDQTWGTPRAPLITSGYGGQPVGLHMHMSYVVLQISPSMHCPQETEWPQPSEADPQSCIPQGSGLGWHPHCPFEQNALVHGQT